MNSRFRIIAICLLVAAAAAGRVFAEDLRDPMRPAGAPTVARHAAVSTIRLEGVIAADQRVAIINGRVMHAGDSIDGARILEVFAHGVRYERAGKVQTLTLASTPANVSVRVARSRPDEVGTKETGP